jgi:hypothetical protein
MATPTRKRTSTRATNGAKITADVPRWSTEDSLAEFEAREHVFSIDDVDYTMPVVCSASVAIEYVAIARSQGLDAAFEYGCRELLGDDEYQRVIHWPGLKGEHITFLTKVVDDKMVEALGGPKDTTS